MKKFALTILFTLLIVVLSKTLLNSSHQLLVSAIQKIEINQEEAAKRLSGAIKITTISTDAGAEEPSNFLKLHSYLENAFPLLHKTLKKEIINHYSLLYEWRGSNPKLAPILLLAHQDVVPIASGTETLWKYPPFSGAIAEGFIWGRGSWDNKGNLLSMMEAIELLIKNHFQPERTIYLASGHDEEAGATAGQLGAKEIADTLKKRGVRLAFVLDEGLLITHKIIKGLDTPLALIGVAEKGYLTLKLTSQSTPGHSSMPPVKSASGELSSALVNLEHDQFPARFTDVIKEMFETIAPEFKGINRVALSNFWLFGTYVRHKFEAIPSSAAMIKTTTGLTIFKSGNKENVMPAEAIATVNFRILPGEKIQNIIDHTKKSVNNERISISTNTYPREPSPIAKTSSENYQLIQKTIREVFPGTLVTPGLMIAATDSYHFLSVADAVYRFTPVHATEEDLKRFHGTNERVSMENYTEMIQFYYRLLSQTNSQK